MRTLARLLAPLLIASGLVLGLQAASDAHANKVTATEVCNHDTGQVDVTWSVWNDYSLTESLSNATRVSSQLNGKTLAKTDGNQSNGGADTAYATESVSPGTSTLVLKVHGHWSDGYAEDDQGSITPLASCVKTKHVTVAATFADQTCDHGTGVFTPGTYSAPAVDGTTQAVTGDTEPGDIIGISFTASANVVIDGTSSFSHTYPAHPTRDTCKPPPTCTACHLPLKQTDAKAVTVCNGFLPAGVYNDVFVKPGTDCFAVGSYVNGSIRATGAHTLALGGTEVRGDVVADKVFNLTVGSIGGTCSADPRIGGSLYALGAHNVVLCNLQVCHGVFITHADGRVIYKDSRSNRLVVRHNDVFVKDGDPRHHALAAVRLHNDKAHRIVIRHNKRPVDRRDVHRAPKIGGGKVCIA